MILYICIIAISMVLICFFNSIFHSICFVEHGLLNLILIVGLAVVIEFLIDLIISGLVSIFPAKTYVGFKKKYKWEKKFYEKLGVKVWKDYVPIGKGPLLIGMDKSKIEKPNDINFLHKLMDECLRAEVMHFLSMFLGFFLILIFPIKYALIISLPVAIVNMFLQLLPFIVQRYNLPKLEVLLERNRRLQMREKKNNLNE